MNKPIIYLLLSLLVVVVALLAVLRVLDVITTDQAMDLGIKLTVVLVIGLAASLVVGMLGRNSDKK
jgi:NADH:ubiquinone oxidoreductase subunit H